MGAIQAFLAELRRRHVFRAAAWYSVASWIVIQVAVNTFPNLLLPEWTVRFVVVLCLLGLPIALVLAWAYELTPEGVRATSAAESGPESRSWVGPSTFVALIAGSLLGIGAVQGWRSIGSVAASEPGIAVMPFENLSPEPDDAYFAEGVHDELLTRLAALQGVRVISRTSVLAFRGLNKSAQQIGKELDISHVLEGSVRREGDRFVLTAQLIDARRDSHLWTERYEGSVVSVFDAQRAIAERIVVALRHELTEREATAVTQVPTQNTSAHEAYLRGRELYGAAGEAGELAKHARAYFEQAIAHDPAFAEAHAMLSMAASTDFYASGNRSNMEFARRHADRALELAPDLAMAHQAAAAAHYFVDRDFAAAELEFRRALELAPADPAIHVDLALVTRRTGRDEEAMAWMRSALRLAPFDPASAQVFAEHMSLYGRWREGLAALDRVLTVSPRDIELQHRRAELLWRWDGDSSALRKLHAEHPERVRESIEWSWWAIHVAIAAEDIETANDALGLHRGVQLMGEPHTIVVPDSLIRSALAGSKDKSSAADAIKHDAEELRAGYYARPAPRSGGLSAAAALIHVGRIEEAEAILADRRESMDQRGERSTAELRRDALVRVAILAARGNRAAALDELESLAGQPGALSAQDLRAGWYLFPELRQESRYRALAGLSNE